MGRHTNTAWEGNTASVGNAFVTEGLTELRKKLDQMLASNPDMEKKIKQIIRKALAAARKRVSSEVASAMSSDPRHAYKAVRTAVYRRILGGNLNILGNKRRGTASSYQPTRTLKSGQRGGNRMSRSERTMRMESYEGADRGFILRFLNAGAKVGGGRRQMSHFHSDPHRGQVNRGAQGGDLSRYGNRSNVNTGNRGSISPRNFFKGASEQAIAGPAMEIIEQEVDRLIMEAFGA